MMYIVVKQLAKGCRGYGAGEPKSGGCDPEKFFNKNSRKHTFKKV